MSNSFGSDICKYKNRTDNVQVRFYSPEIFIPVVVSSTLVSDVKYELISVVWQDYCALGWKIAICSSLPSSPTD